MANPLGGRDKEAAEIVKLRRAAEVGRLMLGELDGPLTPIRMQDYLGKPRAEIKKEREAVRSHLKGELLKFCQRNFSGVRPEDLANLYDLLLHHRSQHRMPLREFVAQVGQPGQGVLKGAPAHSTVCVSPWGLQTEYPEMHLARDLSLAYNDALEAEAKLTPHQGASWRQAKDSDTRSTVAESLRRGAYSRRMCLLSCFNLTEAFVNGIAWEFVQTRPSSLSVRQQKLLTEGKASLLDKLAKVPGIVKGEEPGPLALDRDPLLTFRDLVKPFRDSIVHASPFSAPERFGGYDKLARVYELEMGTVTMAVDLTVSILGAIHKFLGRHGDLPDWMPVRGNDGRFVVS